MLHSGIDLHKRTVVFSTVDPEGTRIAEAELPTTRAAVRRATDPSHSIRLPSCAETL
jgi:hypothetical protein